MRGGDHGFTLVEAIAALALAALAAAGLMSTLGTSRARTVEAEARMLALAEAQHRLAGALTATNLNELPRRGEAEGLLWTITLGSKGDPHPNVARVTVGVTWKAAGKSGVTTLSGYRFVPDA